MTNRTAVSLFSSAGLGELGLARNGFQVLVANELVKSRCLLYRENFPETEMLEGDIWELREDIVRAAKKRLGRRELDLVYATPPCQGMSSNGAGKLKAEVKAGNRPEEDARNRLVIPALDIISKLRPRWVLFENVPNMKDTVIRTDRGFENIIDYIRRRLGAEYVGREQVLTCSDYGIPQIRKRLITLFTRTTEGKRYFDAWESHFFPKHEWTRPPTLRDAIGGFPPLEAISGRESNRAFHPLHAVSLMTPEKHWWVRCTPEGETAFNNQCVNDGCRYDKNRRHVDQLANGSWTSSKTTPIYCQKCGSLLPRPTMVDKKTGERRLISGFHSAYRRMKWDEPCRTLTRNVFWEASDNKIHPDQNRTLSVYEALVIQTVADYDYKWTVGGKEVARKHIADAIGESAPPRLIDFIASKVCSIEEGVAEIPRRAKQAMLVAT